jgi:hypothetical protein
MNVRGTSSHTVEIAGRVYTVESLWRLAKGVPRMIRPIVEFLRFLREDRWEGFSPLDVLGQGARTASIPADLMRQHWGRLDAADLSYPLVVTADGNLIDGLHRVAKAWHSGQMTIAVQVLHSLPSLSGKCEPSRSPEDGEPDPVPLLDALSALDLGRMPGSLFVDLFHLLFLDKPAVRFCTADRSEQVVLEEWAQSAALRLIRHGDDSALYLGHDEEYLRKVCEVDNRSIPHEYELGLLLGYPHCCARAVAHLGEGYIDQLEDDCKYWAFENDYRLINPIGYHAGKAFIAHLPCSSHCNQSLAIGIAAYSRYRAWRHHPAMKTWAIWREGSG